MVRDLAYPLPITIIAELLGVPVEDHEQLKKWSDDYASVLGSFQSLPDNLPDVLKSVVAMTAYLDAIIADRRLYPQDDLMSALIAAQESGNQLSQDELIKNCILLLAAGHETTTNLIANGLYTLLRFPDQIEKLRQEPVLIPHAVEEMLRQALSPHVLIVKADVANRTAMRSFFQHCRETFHSIDALVNNAGLNRDKPFQQLTEEDWDLVVDTNMKGVFTCSQLVAHYMLQQEQGGCIINVAATTGMQGRVNGLNYCAAKAGVLTMTKCLALEGAPPCGTGRHK